MKYLIDTCTISNFVKGHPTVSNHLKSCSPTLISISSISVMEIEYGLSLNLERAKKINPIIESLLSQIRILPFEKEDAEIAGKLRTHLKKAGTPIGPYDLLIGSQALHHGLILVTQNKDEFTRVPALTIETWLN